MLINKQESQGSNINFLSVIAGEFRKTVPEGTPGAVKREWNINGKPGEKWEVSYPAISGLIQSIEFHEGDYGKNLKVWVADGEELNCISAGVKNPFGEDLLKRLPGVNFKEVAVLSPYEFIPKGGDKTLKGVSIKQNEVKVKNFYKDVDGKTINGLPTTDADLTGMDKEEKSEYWKSFFAKQRRFMIKEIEDKIIPTLKPAPVFEKKEEEITGSKLDNF